MDRDELHWPKPGETWRWREPNGAWREMLVERIQAGPVNRRAVGIHPQTGKRLQVLAVTLAKGHREAHLVSAIEGYVWTPRRAVPGTRKEHAA